MTMTNMHNNGGTLKPSYIGFVNTPKDAMVLFEASLQGTVPSITRRPHDRERALLIKSGSVFLYNENSSNIKRWTDGVYWSPSRILGNFLVYRELENPFPPGEKKRARKKKDRIMKTTLDPYPQLVRRDSQDSKYKSSSDSGDAPERLLIGSLVDSYGFKKDGLVKRTMSISVGGVHHHLVSYYKIEDVLSGFLQQPSEDEDFANIEPRAELLMRNNFRLDPNNPEQAFGDQQIREILPGSNPHGHTQYRAPLLIKQAPLHPIPQQQPQHQLQQLQQRQQQQGHNHSQHNGNHNAHQTLGMFYGNPVYTCGSQVPSMFQPVPLQISLPVSSSHHQYHTPTAIAPLPSYQQYDSTGHTVTLPQDPHYSTLSNYHYGRNWVPNGPSLPSANTQSRVSVSSSEAPTPTSDGRSSDTEWQRQSQSSTYSTLASPISAQSTYGAPSTSWPARPILSRNEWPPYKSQVKHEIHQSHDACGLTQYNLRDALANFM